MDLNKKTVLVTGSSRGIGKAIALAFGRAGCNVVLNASKSIVQLEETKTLLEKQNIPTLALLADVSDYKTCRELFAEIEKKFGSVDILVNNAGISHIGLFTDMTPAQWQRILSVNLESALNCTHLAVPSMVHKKNGVIINISSMWGEVGASCEAVYSASKGAINAFTKAMAKELGPSNIRVNAISCGVIDTEMNACFSQEERQTLAEEIPLMRFGKPEEVGDLAVFLASQRAKFLTGKIITLDGGMI
ncbi:elongation factor P 5-aminopentanone reductase [Anaerotignum sp.]